MALFFVLANQILTSQMLVLMLLGIVVDLTSQTVDNTLKRYKDSLQAMNARKVGGT